MINIDNNWYSIDNIKSITSEVSFGRVYLIINYMYGEDPVKIDVDNLENYIVQAERIVDRVEARRG